MGQLFRMALEQQSSGDVSCRPGLHWWHLSCFRTRRPRLVLLLALLLLLHVLWQSSSWGVTNSPARGQEREGEQARRERLARVCRLNKGETNTGILWPWFYYHPASNVLYCRIFKAGSTTYTALYKRFGSYLIVLHYLSQPKFSWCNLHSHNPLSRLAIEQGLSAPALWRRMEPKVFQLGFLYRKHHLELPFLPTIHLKTYGTKKIEYLNRPLIVAIVLKFCTRFNSNYATFLFSTR